MTEYSISASLDDLIHAVYSGPLESVPWQTFLRLFRKAVAASHATLILRPPSENDEGVVLNAVVVSPDVYRAYNDTYFALDPFVNLPAGSVVTLQAFMARDKLLQTEYYQQYMAPIDVFHIMGADMTTSSGLNARLRVTRSEAAGDFCDDDKALCQLLLPHLQRSIELHGSLKRTETEREVYSDAIDQLAMGCLILDAKANVLRTNKAADQLLAENGLLKIKKGRLQVGGHNENKAFRTLIEKVLSAHRQSEPGCVKAFRVGDIGITSPLGLLVRALPRVEASQDISNPSLVIFISDPGQRRLLPVEILGALFDFTPAESELALLLANGLTLDEAAKELQVSRNTVKSHLSAVFSKTGLTRQTKLIQLILKSVAPLGQVL